MSRCYCGKAFRPRAYGSPAQHSGFRFARSVLAGAVALVIFAVVTPSVTAQESDPNGVDADHTPVEADEPLETGERDDVQAPRVAEGDWGGTVDVLRSLSAAGHKDSDARTSVLSTALWARGVIPIGRLSSLDLAVQGSYNWSSGQIYANVDIMRLEGIHPELLGQSSVVRTRLGRFRFQDPSSLVFNESSDGASVRLEYPGVRLGFSAAYTGLQLNPVSTARMTSIDLIEEEDENTLFGPRRAVGIARVEFPELFARQTVQTGVVGQLDLRDADEDEQTIDSGYAMVGLRGPLVGNLYHDIYGAGTLGSWESGGESERYWGYLGSARLRLFLPDFLSSRISLQGIYAAREDSSEEGDFGDGFRPISRNRLGTAVAVALENVLYGELSYSMRPLVGSESQQAQRFQVQLAGRSYFTTSDRPAALDPRTEGTGGDLQYTGLDPDPDGRFIGGEGVFRLNARPMSDLGLGATLALFVPDTRSSGVFTDDRGPQFLSRLELSTRF